MNLILVLAVFVVPMNPVGPVPSARQLAWHDREAYAFIHFGVNTFSGMEWGHGNEDPKSFNPSELDTDQWCRIFKEAGLTGVVLTAKHHDGFCLWPSALTEHSVKNSPWNDGEGDLLFDLSQSCEKYGLHLGLYISPWDRNNPLYGTGDEYNEYFASQLRDILTNYGTVTEVWFDGACGEGPNGKRQVYDWPLFHSVVRELQPGAVMFSDGGPDIRWIGNEQGFAGETNWSTLNRDDFYPGVPNKTKALNEGQEGGTHWLPGEVDVSIRPGWFYHADQDDKVKTPDKLMHIWLESVGRNANLLLNFPIDQRGLVHENDQAAVLAMHKKIETFTANDVALGAVVRASNFRDAYQPSTVVDGKPDTFWATEDGVTTAAIEVEFSTSEVIHGIDIAEHIQLGQRVRSFVVEAQTKNGWEEVAKGTTIGHRRILAFDPISATGVRIRITDSLGPITIETLNVYATNSSEPQTLDDDGGWCWFQDERCIVRDDVLYIGSVSSGYNDATRKGDINIITLDLSTSETSTVELHDQLQLDDHNLPGLLATDDGVFAMWSTHGSDWNIYSNTLRTDGTLATRNVFLPSERDGYGATYSNLFSDPSGTITDIYRGNGWDPNVIRTSNNGETWTEHGRLLGGPGRPYVRFVQDIQGRIHIFATEQHPRNFDNSLYHGMLDGDAVCNSFGEVVGSLGEHAPAPESLTKIFSGDADNVPWCSAIEMSKDGFPVVAYSVQKNSAGMKVGTGGEDHRYRYAWFDGKTWNDHEVAFAGNRLYPREDDYTGLIAIDPSNTSTVYFSTNAHPETGRPLISRADNTQHYEIWRGTTNNGGENWKCTAVTSNSTADNIRPMMPTHEGDPILLWMQGSYTTYQNYNTKVRCLIGADIPSSVISQ